MRRLLLVLALVVLPSLKAQSQKAPIVATWDSVFRTTFDAYDRHDWRALAREADPGALREFKDEQLAMGQQILESLKARPADSTLDVHSEIAYVEGQRAELERASPESVFVRMTQDLSKDGNDHRPAVVRRIVGHAAEGDSLVHIVFRYRTSWPAHPPLAPRGRDAVDMLTLRRSGGRWRPMLNGGLAWHFGSGMDLIQAVQ
jgi:hypothetical protein